MSEILTPYSEINKVLRELHYSFVCTVQLRKKQHVQDYSIAACMISRDRALGMTVQSLAGDEPGHAVSLTYILVTHQIYTPIYIQQRCNFTQFIYIWKLLYMFRVVPPPIIRSPNNCIYSIWYLSQHRYSYLPL
jgi:hypothetical protein